MSPRILLTGKDGQVGSELRALLQSKSEVIALGRGELDLENAGDIRDVIRQTRPSIIVNAAAYTAVDQAEAEEAKARAVNAAAPGVMAEEAKKIGAVLIHYSTDYVFDGTKHMPYVEEDPPNPLSVYGRTKLEGEQAIQQSGAAHLIFRTAWVYARSGKNFLLTILKLASEREELRVVQDQIGAPTFNRNIAEATSQIIERMTECPNGSTNLSLSGLYHLSAAGETSWYGFAKAILEEASQNPELPWLVEALHRRSIRARRLIPIKTAEYHTAARRPAYSLLSNDRLASVFGLQLPDWRVQLHSAFVGDSF